MPKYVWRCPECGQIVNTDKNNPPLCKRCGGKMYKSWKAHLAPVIFRGEGFTRKGA